MAQLTPKQDLFCNKYLECGNASEAYRCAYNCEKMKSSTVNRKAIELMNNGKVMARVKELQKENRAKTDITRDRLLDELRCYLDANIADYVSIEERTRIVEDEEVRFQIVTFKNFEDLTPRQLRAVESVKQGRNGIELKLHGKSWTIDRLCKMLGFDAPTEINLKKSIQEMTDEELIQIRDSYE